MTLVTKDRVMRQPHNRLLLASILMLAAIPFRAAGAKTICCPNYRQMSERLHRNSPKGQQLCGTTRRLSRARLGYEVETIVNGHSGDVAIPPDRAVTEVEERLR